MLRWTEENKMKVRIIVDSTADMAPRYRGRAAEMYRQRRHGGEELIDGVSIDRRRFYERLVESDELPTTSQASPAVFQQLYEDAKRAGESAVVITISSKLSGTYQSACLAAADYENVYVVDSLSAAIGTGILAEYAIGCAEAGMDAVSLAAHLEQKRADICVIGLLDTLEYLKRGGRISKTVAFAGGLLSIKPVVTIQDGEIALIGKARGSRQGNNLLVEKIHACGGIDFQLPILLGYTGLSDAFLRKYVDDSRALWEHGTDSLDEALISGVIGTHAGPGAVAVAFFRKV